MKTLLIGLGQIGLGLIVPVFQKAGHTIVGTDANQDRLNDLHKGYILKTPSGVAKIRVDLVGMNSVTGPFDLVVTSVGRQHLSNVAAWCQEKGILAPVLMAENLPDPVSFFPEQIPIVVDRICPRIEIQDSLLVVVTEDYYKIVVLDDSRTRQLGTVEGVGLESSRESVEKKRKQKMFTVNTSHVLTAIFGQQLGCSFIEEAIVRAEVVSRVQAAIFEIAPWLGFDFQEVEKITKQITQRFASPVKDSLSRILSPTNRKSALRYIEVPLNGLYSMGLQASTLEEVRTLLGS